MMIVGGDLSEYQLLRSSNVKTYLIKLEDFVKKFENSNRRANYSPDGKATKPQNRKQ